MVSSVLVLAITDIVDMSHDHFEIELGLDGDYHEVVINPCFVKDIFSFKTRRCVSGQLF